MKRRRNNRILPITVLAAIIIFASVLLLLSQKSFFPEKLGDMELKLHREGDVAVREVQNSHSAKDNVSPDQAHIARYWSSKGNKATVSVTEAETEKRAIDEAVKRIGG